MTRKRFSISSSVAAIAVVAVTMLPFVARGAFVDLGAAGGFAALALTHGIDDSGPIGPNGQYSINGNVGVASAGQKFQASGSVSYSGKLYLHTGVTYNSSAQGVPQPQPQNAANDAYLAQARSDAFAASTFASGLTATATYGSITNNLTISEKNAGNYVFNITSVNFSGGKTLTLDAPTGSSYVLNISNSLVLTSGSIVVSGGLSASNVLINYTGTSTVQFSGGGNASAVYGTILAPNAEVGLHPGFVAGSVIADTITMSSGAQIGIVPVPEVTSTSLIFGFVGLVVAIGSRRALAARLARKSA